MGPDGVGPDGATCFSSPHVPETSETGGLIGKGLQGHLDTEPHGVPPGYESLGRASDWGLFEAEFTDHPGTQQRPGSTRRPIPFGGGNDLAGAFAIYPASLAPRNLRGNPDTGHVDQLPHHTPAPSYDLLADGISRHLATLLNIEFQAPSVLGATIR